MSMRADTDTENPMAQGRPAASDAAGMTGLSRVRTVAGDKGQITAKVELDEDLLLELARTVSPRQHRRFLIAQLGLLSALVAILIALAVGAVMKLGELTASLDELSQIQEGISGMATDLNSMANNVAALKVMEASLKDLSGNIGGMTDDISRLSNLGSQIGDALGSGAGSAITSLAQGGINTAVSALRGLITGDTSGGGGDAGDAEGDPARSQRLAASAFGPCDPNSTNATELVDCLNHPEQYGANATAAEARSPGATGNRGGGGGRNRDRNGGGGGGFDWQGLLGSVLNGVGQVAGEVLSNAASGGGGNGGGGSGGGNPARPPGP